MCGFSLIAERAYVLLKRSYLYMSLLPTVAHSVLVHQQRTPRATPGATSIAPCLNVAPSGAGIPKGYLKCFMMAAAYGIWLRPADVRSRVALASAMSRQYDPSVAISRDGSGLEVIFIDREEDAHKFNDAKEPGRDDVQPERAWAQASQRAAMVLVAGAG